MHSFELLHVEGIRRRTRPACEERNTDEKKPVTLLWMYRHGGQWAQKPRYTRRWNCRNSPAMATKFIHHPPFLNSLIPFLATILQEKSSEAYFSRAWASEGTVFALPLEYMLCWPCQRCVTWDRHALWVRVTDRGLALRNYRNHLSISTDWSTDRTSEFTWKNRRRNGLSTDICVIYAKD